ncbi:hypothetical protein ACFL3S_00700 [Gemmatimonadota bacterium]
MTMERSTRARLSTAAILVLVLGAGVALGMALGPRLTLRNEAGEVQSRRGGESREGRSEEASQRRRPLIVDQVGLSLEQKTQVDSIVTSQRDQMRALQEEFDEAYMPRYRGIVENTREAIRAVLTADQRVAYDSLLADHDRRRQERRSQDSISDSRG